MDKVVFYFQNKFFFCIRDLSSAKIYDFFEINSDKKHCNDGDDGLHKQCGDHRYYIGKRGQNTVGKMADSLIYTFQYSGGIVLQNI